MLTYPSTVAASILLLLSSSLPSAVDSFSTTVPVQSSVELRKTLNGANFHGRLTQLHAVQGNDDNNKDNKKSPMQVIGTAVLSTMLFWNTLGGGGLVGPTPVTPPVANAVEGAKIVGALKGSGLVFKDTLQIERFNDPKVQGVVLYISNFERPITEKLSGKNFFNDPSSAGVACAKIGKISIADNIAKGPGTFADY